MIHINMGMYKHMCGNLLVILFPVELLDYMNTQRYICTYVRIYTIRMYV